MTRNTNAAASTTAATALDTSAATATTATAATTATVAAASRSGIATNRSLRHPSGASFRSHLVTSANYVYGNDIEHMFDTARDDGDKNDCEEAEGQTAPLLLRRDAAAGGEDLSHESSVTMLLDHLKTLYNDVLAAHPPGTNADTEADRESDVQSGPQSGSQPGSQSDAAAGVASVALSVAALACARHAAACLGPELEAITAPERGDVVWRLVPGPDEDCADRAFWDLLATKLYAYTACFFPTAWQARAGLTDDADWSMPVWESPAGVVCDLFVYLTPWDDEGEIAAVVQHALDLALDAFGSAVAGVRVLPLFAPYLARWYWPDGTWTHLPGANDVPAKQAPAGSYVIAKESSLSSVAAALALKVVR